MYLTSLYKKNIKKKNNSVRYYGIRKSVYNIRSTPYPSWDLFFALNGVIGLVGSGIGFIFNFLNLFTNAATYAVLVNIEVWLFYILLVVFAIFILSGGLQLIGIKSRAITLIFSFFPLGVGVMFVLLFYTGILGPISSVFALFLQEGKSEIFSPFL